MAFSGFLSLFFMGFFGSTCLAEAIKGYTLQVGSSINTQYVIRSDAKNSHNICRSGEQLRSIPSGVLVSLQGEWTIPLNRVKKKMPKCFSVSKIDIEKMPSGRKPLTGKVSKGSDAPKLTLSDGTTLALAKIPEGMITKLDQPLFVDTDPAFDASNKEALKQVYHITVWIEEPNPPTKTAK